MASSQEKPLSASQGDVPRSKTVLSTAAGFLANFGSAGKSLNHHSVRNVFLTSSRTCLIIRSILAAVPVRRWPQRFILFRGGVDRQSPGKGPPAQSLNEYFTNQAASLLTRWCLSPGRLLPCTSSADVDRGRPVPRLANMG